MSNNPMPENEKEDRSRVQAKLDVKNNPDFARTFYRAMEYGRRQKPNQLLRVIVEDWLRAFESGRAIRCFEPPEPPPKTKSDERPAGGPPLLPNPHAVHVASRQDVQEPRELRVDRHPHGLLLLLIR